MGCGTLVEIEGDQVVKVAGDPDDTTTLGYTCSKGRAGPEFHHASQRLVSPQVRRDAELVAVGWDEALDDIAARMQALIAEYGPGVIANYVGTGGPIDPAGYAMAHGFFRALGSSDQSYSALSVDCSGKALVPQLVAGVQLMFQPDLEHAKLFLAFGVNTVVSHGHGVMMANPITHLRSLRDRGGRFVVVDPRLSETARHADLHVQLRPGTDPALLAFLVRHILSTTPDTTYLDKYADEASVDHLRAVVAPFDVLPAAAICGVEIETLEGLADMVTTSGRVAIETGTGTTLNPASTLTEWLVWSLSAVTGSLDRVGGATFNPGFLRRFEDGLPSGRGDLAPGPLSRPDLPRIVNGEMPCAALVDEIEAGYVRALFVRAGNPALAFPDNARLRRALRMLEMLVVIDVRPTETTDVATHVLPMTDHFERGDLLTGYLQPKPFMRYCPPVVSPIGERRQQWWMFAELSRRMGLPLFASARRDAALSGLELDDEMIAEAMLGQARHSWREVREARYGMVDESLEPGWLIPDRLPRLLDLAPPELIAEFRRAAVASVRADTGLIMINRRTADRYNSLSLRSEPSALEIHPLDAAECGIADGGLATISTAMGSCSVAVRVTDRIRRGVVSLPHGIGAADVNQLTSSAEADSLSGMPVLSGFPVTVTAA